MTDHSQSGEQAMIEEWATRRDGPGRWLDIGAADGTTASNTRWLAQQGWAGVAVEPSPSYFNHLANLYADRDDVECVQAAVDVDDSQLVRFYLSDDLVSTTEESHADTWGELTTFRRVTAAAVTVDVLLSHFPGPYDFISVDTEGTSLEITTALLRVDLKTLRIADCGLAPGGLLCVECEDGGERWTAQQWSLYGLARVGVTPNNLLLERL